MIWGNTLQSWGLALLVFALVFLILRLLNEYALSRLKRAGEEISTELQSLIFELTRRTHPIFLIVIALYLASLTLYLPASGERMIRVVTVVIALLQMALWGSSAMDYFIERRLSLEGEVVGERKTTLSAFRILARIVLWVVVILLILENATGIEINALLASLGIGGIAVALAVQNILGDLFSSLTIALDKPFVIGDVIQVGNLTGRVEKIGLKSTRLRSVDGELLVFANSDLLSSRIRNFGDRQRWRVAFSLSVAYDTASEKLNRIPQIVREIVERHENTTFGWAFIKALGDFRITFDCAYHIEGADLQEYMDTSHLVYLELLQRFQQEGIELSFPTQEVRLRQSE